MPSAEAYSFAYFEIRLSVHTSFGVWHLTILTGSARWCRELCLSAGQVRRGPSTCGLGDAQSSAPKPRSNRGRKSLSYPGRIGCRAVPPGMRHSAPALRKPTQGLPPPGPQRPPDLPRLRVFERSLQSVLRGLPTRQPCFLLPTRLASLSSRDDRR